MCLPEPGKTRFDRHTGTQQYFYFIISLFHREINTFLPLIARNFNFKNPFALFAGDKNAMTSSIRRNREKLLAAVWTAIP